MMPDYDLTGLSTRSFEQLIQAIASKVIGPGITVFGDGPDGGREATFEGRVPFPAATEQWDGYGVIQAKFLQRSRGSRQEGQWALRELRRELEAYADKGGGRRIPEYYIFATNAILSPVQHSGAKDKVTNLFKRYRRKVPIRDWRVWDFDQLRTFLDTHDEIRRTYAAFVTAGDVLARTMNLLETCSTDFDEVITNFLAKELLSDQFANLEQAGHSVEDRIPLANVFVDLPTSNERLVEPPDEDPSKRRELPEFVTTIVTSASERLDPGSASRRSAGPIEAQDPVRGRPEPGRFVLIGGPGQGKTTVGQFVCQLFRTALLADRPPHLLSLEVKAALENIKRQCVSEERQLPKARRFPVRIVLSEFAATLKQRGDDSASLISYIAARIRKRVDRDIRSDDLRRWLACYPWLLVLDGLDEVPASTNRDEVLKKVEEFWVDASQCNADVLVLATTRPQGYNEDFSPTYYRHMWLAPLSVARAMQYASRLVDVRYGNDQDRRQKVLTRLRQASTHESTARLMRSPLQVTIMATLVDRIGQPPQDRWRLFSEYYQVIYRREMERDNPAAELLRDLRTDIDMIHGRVALLLQMESERAGGTEARISSERFGIIVEARLAKEGHTGSDLQRLKAQIIEATANRLVFLVGLQAGQVGFEIRSLQEFMAAEALMQGPEMNIQDRLRQIAAIANWRNVFLFAAGRCFAQDQHLRDTIVTICADLNGELAGAVGHVTLAGSMLALDLLEDGVVHRSPKYAKILAEYAHKLMDLPPADIHSRLADACEPVLETLFKEEIQKRMDLAVPAARLGAWATLLPLIGAKIPWSEQAAAANWPDDVTGQLAILSTATIRRADVWAFPRTVACAQHLHPRKLWSIRRRFEISEESALKVWLLDVPGIHDAGLNVTRT